MRYSENKRVNDSCVVLMALIKAKAKENNCNTMFFNPPEYSRFIAEAEVVDALLTIYNKGLITLSMEGNTRIISIVGVGGDS